MKQETIERLRKREAMHWGHRAVEAECTETISLADFRDILAVLEAAQKYAEAKAKSDAQMALPIAQLPGDWWELLDVTKAKLDALLALIDLETK